jgi:hypothetical protein
MTVVHGDESDSFSKVNRSDQDEQAALKSQ